eukprot:3420606-Rhodomonas_salina.3
MYKIWLCCQHPSTQRSTAVIASTACAPPDVGGGCGQAFNVGAGLDYPAHEDWIGTGQSGPFAENPGAGERKQQAEEVIKRTRFPQAEGEQQK